MPEVGQPLYAVKNADEAKIIVTRIRAREDKKRSEAKAASGEGFLVNEMKKKMGKLTRLEKRAIKGGDKSIIYEKLGMLEESDIQAYKGKYGVKEEDLDDA